MKNNDFKKVMEEWIKFRTDKISEMFDNKYKDGIYPTSKFFEAIDGFILFSLQSETAKAREEMKSEIKDIIIDWEKKLGSLKTKAGGYVNLTYLLGKIK